MITIGRNGSCVSQFKLYCMYCDAFWEEHLTERPLRAGDRVYQEDGNKDSGLAIQMRSQFPVTL